MNRYSVHLTDLAVRDVYEIRDWYRDHSSEAADLWVAGLIRALGSLEFLPERCGLAED